MDRVFLPDSYQKYKSNSGNAGIELVYGYRKDKQGRTDLVVIDKKDVYKEIQTYKDDTNIYSIIEKCGGIENLSKLDTNKGFYADVSEFPDNINDYHNMEDECREKFNSLPIDVKAKFNQDYNVFMTSLFNGDFEKIMSDKMNLKDVESKIDVQKEVVNDDMKGDEKNE